jgi:hypothetical protein
MDVLNNLEYKGPMLKTSDSAFSNVLDLCEHEIERGARLVTCDQLVEFPFFQLARTEPPIRALCTA